MEARGPGEIDRALLAMTRERAEALLVLMDAIFYNEREKIAGLAAKNRLPAVYGLSVHAEAGGLMAYGAKRFDQLRRMAIYVDKILKGASQVIFWSSSRRSSSWSSTSRPPRPSASRSRSRSSSGRMK